MKKILIFSLTYYPRFVGGAEVAIKEITDRISPSDYEFHMVTLRLDSMTPKVEKIGNVTIHRVGWGRRNRSVGDSFSTFAYIEKILFVPLAAIKGRSLHRRQHFDAVWAMMSYMVFPLVLMRLFGTNISYVLSLQEGDPFDHVFKRVRIRFFSPLLLYGIRHADVVTALSQYLGRWARAMGYKGKVEIVPNAVDTKHFSQEYPPEEIEKIRLALGKKPGDIFLVTTSRLVTKNAVDDVIRALPRLPEKVHFVVLGEGPDRETLERFAKAKEVEGRVHFFGHIGHGVMPKYLKACDIFVRPSRSEGFGASFSEAMAAGLPIIATQEGGIADFLFDAKRNPDVPPTGWAVDRDAPEQIAKTVMDILEHPEQAQAVVENAKKLVRKKYDWDIIARQMTSVLDRLTARAATV